MHNCPGQQSSLQTPSTKLILSTHAGLYLAELTEKTISLLELSVGYYYGLADYGEYILAARRVDPWSCKVSSTVFEKWSKEGKSLGVEYRLDGNRVIDVHEICLSKHGLFICNGGKQEVDLYDENFKLKRKFDFSLDNIPGGRLINSIFADGDDFWLMFHNRESPSFIQQMRFFGNDTIFCQRLPIGCSGSHNIFIKDGILFYNASSLGALHSIQIDSIDSESWDDKGTIKIKYNRLSDTMHTKGMAYDKTTNSLIIGISKKGELSDRFKAESALILIDPESLKVKSSVLLVKASGENIGNINEILLLS